MIAIMVIMKNRKDQTVVANGVSSVMDNKYKV